MSTNKQPGKHLLWWIGLYVLSDKALIPTRYETDAGFHLDREPVLEFDYRNKEEFVSALSQVVKDGNPRIHAPDPEEVQKAVPTIQRYIKAKSWNEAERRTIHFSIECVEDEFIITCSQRAADGTWARGKDSNLLERHIPLNEGIAAVVDVILDHLSERSDLPGLPITRTA
ncbi:MAG TPA: hypothetical protein V6D08_15630 [Candidatus Obscuribacterales bacterium]